MTHYKYFCKKNTKDNSKIELVFSIFFFISGNPRWFCRKWDYRSGCPKIKGESYGRTKFEAYRKALRNKYVPKQTI